MPSSIDIVNDNKFLQALRIHEDYKIELKFAGLPPESEAPGSNSIPVARALLAKTIIFIPQFGGYGVEGQPMSMVINSWGCATDADEGVETFMGSDSSATIGNISFISTNENSSDNVYLSQCVYVSNVEISTVLSTLMTP